MMVLYSGTTCPFSTLPLRVVRERHGFRDPRHRPVQQARRHLGDEPVRSSAHSGRARPGPVQSNIINGTSTSASRTADAADPVMRARTRLFLYNFEKELFVHVSTLEDQRQARREGWPTLARTSATAWPSLPHAAEEQVHAGRGILHAGRGRGPAAVAPGPLTRTEERGAAAEVRRAHLLASGLHRSADAFGKGHASLRQSDG